MKVQKVIINNYDKKCHGCERTVHARMGHAVQLERSTGGSDWFSYHNECLPPEYKEMIKQEKKSNYITENGEIYMNYNPANLPLVKSIPLRAWNPEKKCWRFPVSEVESVFVAVRVAEIIGLEVPESLKKIAASKPASDVVEKRQIDKKLVERLFPYQVKGAEFLANNKYALLGDEMGTGKSVQALAALPKKAKVIIVCPASLKYNWQNEAKKWRPEFSTTVVKGKKSFSVPKENEIVILNREVVPEVFLEYKNLTPEFKAEYKDVYLIADEAHLFKGTATKAHKKIKTLGRLCSHVWALTGTPLLNRPTDLWGVLAAFSMEGIVFNTNDGRRPWEVFFSSFNAVRGRYGIIWGMPQSGVPELISRVRLARKRADVLPELPNKIYTDIQIDITPEIKEDLDTLAIEVDDDITSNRLPAFNKFSTVRNKIAKSRIPSLLEYVESCEEQETPLVVFSAHVAPLDMLRVRAFWGVIDGSTPPEERQRIVEDFQNGKLNGVACTIGAGGVGLTLTRAWKVLFVDLDWVPANNWQAEDRVARIGQKSKKVEIVRFTSRHELDQRIHDILTTKRELIEAALG